MLVGIIVTVRIGSGANKISCDGNCSNIHGKSNWIGNTSNMTLKFNPII